LSAIVKISRAKSEIGYRRRKIRAAARNAQLRRHANSIGSGHASEDHAFLQAVAQSIADAGAVLVTGPANVKTELVKHISKHDPRLMNIIVGVETVDHPSDGELVAHARRYFKAEDRMLPQKG
jgi:hypothetical protein